MINNKGLARRFLGGRPGRRKIRKKHFKFGGGLREKERPRGQSADENKRLSCSLWERLVDLGAMSTRSAFSHWVLTAFFGRGGLFLPAAALLFSFAPLRAASTDTATIIFNDAPGTNAPLNGQYPAGVADWGANNAWFISGPFNQFTTKSVSLGSGTQTSATVTFLTPRRLVSLRAHNGTGGVPATVTLRCAGQPTVQAVVGVNEVKTIETGWTGNCSAVNLSCTNNWNTNFDDWVHDAVLGAGAESAAFGDVFAFPNPFQPYRGDATITFTGLPETAILRVYSLGGRAVATLRESDGDGVFAWDVKDDEGNPLASGVYVYVIESGTDEKVGKIVVVR